MIDYVTVTKDECQSLCDFIETNLMNDIRNDEDIDSMTWLVNIINAFQKMAECCGYSGYSYDAKSAQKNNNVHND